MVEKVMTEEGMVEEVGTEEAVLLKFHGNGQAPRLNLLHLFFLETCLVLWVKLQVLQTLWSVSTFLFQALLIVNCYAKPICIYNKLLAVLVQ